MKLLVLPGDGAGPEITSAPIQVPAARHARPDLTAAARTMTAALDGLLANPATRTADLGGTLETAAFGEAVARAVLAG
jgi:3-isopropylmalate dehydrogenase